MLRAWLGIGPPLGGDEDLRVKQVPENPRTLPAGLLQLIAMARENFSKQLGVVGCVYRVTCQRLFETAFEPAAGGWIAENRFDFNGCWHVGTQFEGVSVWHFSRSSEGARRISGRITVRKGEGVVGVGQFSGTKAISGEKIHCALHEAGGRYRLNAV